MMPGQIFQSFNPATQEIIWEGPEASSKEVDAAFKAASKAFNDWCFLPLQERIGYLEKYKNLVAQSQDHLAEVLSKETGKPLWESKTEVSAMINKIDISIEAYSIRCAEMSHQQASQLSITRHRPHGVIAVFGPYNFPGHLPNGHIIPALLAGNTIIFKPSEMTPLTGECMVNLWIASGLPAGVLNLVQGGPNTGKLIASHPALNGLFFTGSWPTGKLLLEQFSSHPEKILALELGGNNPLIIHDVKDIETAAYLTLQSAYITTGQRCTCARRLIIVEGEKNQAFVPALVEEIKRIRIGPYNQQPEPYMGPLISEKAADKMLEAQKNLISLGGVSINTMQKLKPGTGFITPGLMDVTNVKHLPDEEYFGPFLQIIRVPSLKKAIEVANQTNYGLVAGLLSDRPEAYMEFYRHIKAGVINWNTQLTGASSSAPFGGIGRSGNFRPSAFYAADYCAYPVASLETKKIKMPEKITPGLIDLLHN